MYARVGTNL